jgi:hypothetical protein
MLTPLLPARAAPRLPPPLLASPTRSFLQVKTIVSILLRRYEFEVIGPMPTPNYRAMVVGPMQPDFNGVKVRYRLRKPAPPKVPFTPIKMPAMGAAARGAAAAVAK